MARRYELPDAAWELIKDLASPEQKMGRRAVMIDWCSMVSLLWGGLARPAGALRPVVNGVGVVHRFMLSPGQASDIGHAQPLLEQIRIPGKPGRPRKRCRWLLADKGYDAEHLRQYCDRYRMQPVIPQRTMKRKPKPKPGLPRLFDRPKYRQRNIIERMFGWLKENRRIGTRYDKLASSFAAMATLACTLRCLRRYFSYKT